jgi:DNA replication initiation complex subunit (GINS family)
MELHGYLRAEKNDLRLLELPKNFFVQVKYDISILEVSLKTAHENDADIIEQNIITAKRSLTNLIDLRIKKVIKSAVSDAYRAKPEHVADKMEPDERELYEAIISGISKLRGIKI